MVPWDKDLRGSEGSKAGKKKKLGCCTVTRTAQFLKELGWPYSRYRRVFKTRVLNTGSPAGKTLDEAAFF